MISYWGQFRIGYGSFREKCPIGTGSFWDVNVNSFCSFLAKKYVGFWQRFIRGGIFPLFIVFLYLKMLLLNYQQMLLR